MSGPIRIALEFDAKSAKEQIDSYVREFLADPAHWPNNKRRRMGLRPLRKPINTKHRAMPDLFLVWKIVEDALREAVLKPVDVGNDAWKTTCLNRPRETT